MNFHQILQILISFAQTTLVLLLQLFQLSNILRFIWLPLLFIYYFAIGLGIVISSFFLIILDRNTFQNSFGPTDDKFKTGLGRRLNENENLLDGVNSGLMHHNWIGQSKPFVAGQVLVIVLPIQYIRPPRRLEHEEHPKRTYDFYQRRPTSLIQNQRCDLFSRSSFRAKSSSLLESFYTARSENSDPRLSYLDTSLRSYRSAPKSLYKEKRIQYSFIPSTSF